MTEMYISVTEARPKFAEMLENVHNGPIYLQKRGETVATLLEGEHSCVALPRPVEVHVPWARHASAGTPGSPVAADGREHASGFPCPAGAWFLSEDRRLWLGDYPPVNLKTVDRVLTTAFPMKKRAER